MIFKEKHKNCKKLLVSNIFFELIKRIKVIMNINILNDNFVNLVFSSLFFEIKTTFYMAFLNLKLSHYNFYVGKCDIL